MSPPLLVLFIPGAALFFLIQMILCRAYRFEVKLIHHKARPHSPMLKSSQKQDEKRPPSQGKKDKNLQNPQSHGKPKPNQPHEDRIRGGSQESKRSNESEHNVMFNVPHGSKDREKENPGARNRRYSVCAESYDPATDTDNVKVAHPKSPEERQWLQKNLKNVSLFQHLANDQLNTVTEAMLKYPVKKGEEITREGDEGNTFYVIQDGVFDVFVKDYDNNQELVKTYTNSGSFGELALLYNQPRAATVKARTDGILWSVDGGVFRRIVYKITYQKRMMYENLINNVPMLQELEPYERANLVDALVPMTFEDGQRIITQGDEADGMYFIISGGVKVVLKDGGDMPHTLTELTNGDYFGELGLLTKRPRVASVIAVGTTHLAFLQRESFERLLGHCMDIMKRNIDGYNARLAEVLKEFD